MTEFEMQTSAVDRVLNEAPAEQFEVWADTAQEDFWYHWTEGESYNDLKELLLEARVDINSVAIVYYLDQWL